MSGDGPYTEGRSHTRSPPVSLLVDVSALTRRPLLQPESLIFTKVLKDTRLANDFWRFGKTSSFDIPGISHREEEILGISGIFSLF